MPVIAVRWPNVTKIGRLLAAVLRSDIVFIWFVSGQAATSAFFFAKAFRKKTVVVAGGSEVSRDEAIHGYGLRSAVRFLFTRIMLNHSDYVIAVSESTKKEVQAISAPRNLNVVYHGVDAERFTCDNGKDLSIITVAAGRTIDQVRRKGLDRFAQLARCLPDKKFIAIGEAATHPAIMDLFPKNVQTVGKISDQQLLSYYQRATFYCQLSRHEGFGVAVAEAMSSKCVPIVSDAGALPEVVNTCGFVVPNGDPAKAAAIIEENIGMANELGNLARSRVLATFPIEKRATHLRRIISETSPPNSGEVAK